MSKIIIIHVNILIFCVQAASYGKKNGMWYGGTATGTSGWSRAGTRKQSVAESDAPPPGGGKSTSGRVIRIINNMDHSIQVKLWCSNLTKIDTFIVSFPKTPGQKIK